MKVHEILQQNADLLRALARAGAAIEDVRYIPLWSDYERLRRDGFKVAYIVAYLCDTYEVSADMDMEDLFDELGYDDPENTDWEHKPVGEWVYEQFDMIPAQGESFTWHRLKVTVESIDHRRIRKLLIRLLPEETQEGGEEA